MMTERFHSVFAKIVEVEGGYVNNMHDYGGATKFGITVGTLSRFRGVPCVAEDVRRLSLAEAEIIYKKVFWDPYKLDDVKDDNLSYVIFDQMVNSGPAAVIRQLQKLLKEHFYFSDVSEDGVMGPRTLSAINSLPANILALEFIQRRQIEYVRICEQNMTQIRFLRGWLSRTHKLQNLFLGKKS